MILIDTIVGKPSIVDMFLILRWYLYFEFNHILFLKFIDNFEFNDEWSFIQLKHANKVISLGYMNKFPQVSIKNADMVLFRKYTTYKLKNEGTGYCILSENPDNINIPNITTKIIERIPYTTVYKFIFDYDIMMMILVEMEDIIILDKYIEYTRSTIIYQHLKIDIVSNILSYTGSLDSNDKQIENNKKFRDFCIYINNMYNVEKYKYEELINLLDPDIINPSLTHLSLDFNVWYKGSRENQREWPIISTTPLNNRSIEFPKNSGIYYSPIKDNQYVGLSLRHDDNPLLYIPKLFLKDHRIQTSYMNDYINNTNNYNPFQLSQTVKDTVKKYGTLLKPPYNYNNFNNSCLYVNYNGTIYCADNNAKFIVYKSRIIGKVKVNIDLPLCNVQLLDSQFNRSMIYVDNKWIKSQGIRINKVKSLPHYYRSIIHDYNKLGRLINGPYMDLTHIGIVDENGTDIITFPVDNIKDLYIGKNLETHKLCTFKFKPYIYESHHINLNGTETTSNE